MIIFWIFAGGLVALALVFALAPLLQSTPPKDALGQDSLNLEVFRQRLKELDADLEAGFLDEERYAAARHDLERELLYDVRPETQDSGTSHAASAASRWLLGAGLAIVLPVSAVLVYLQLGQPQVIDRLQAAATGQPDPGQTGQQAAASLDELVKRLEGRLQEQPDNLDGWLMLGRTYFATEKPEQGLKAVEKAYGLAPDRADVKLAYAEALAAASPTKSLEGRPEELISSVLEQDAKNPIARWLAGMVSFQRGQYEPALSLWEEVLTELDPNGDEAASLRGMIAEARERAGIQPATQEAGDAARPEPADTAAEAAAIEVQVQLSPALSDSASPEDTVFVFARAAAGPPMPLAVQRLQVKDLPKTLTLDDSMAMTPAMKLSAFDRVVVGARVSKSGNAMPQSGDLFGETGQLQSSAKAQASVTIDRIRP